MMTHVESITAIAKLKTSNLRLNLCDYSNAYILVTGTITVAEVAAGGGDNNI